MNELSGDNFEYLLQLTKVLANECRQTRQETDKIELLFKRVAKQSAISYEDLSAKVPTETLESYEKLSTPNTIDQLINENYALLYKIEQRDYINAKIFALINNINDHLASIKNFVIEQKFTREQDLENFVYENIEAKRNIVNANMENLKKKKTITQSSLEQVIAKFRKLYNDEIDWSLISTDSSEYKNLVEQIENVENNYHIKLR